MYKDLQSTCTAIFLLIKPFVWRRSRCRCLRGLLKFPAVEEGKNLKFKTIFFLPTAKTPHNISSYVFSFS